MKAYLIATWEQAPNQEYFNGRFEATVRGTVEVTGRIRWYGKPPSCGAMMTRGDITANRVGGNLTYAQWDCVRDAAFAALVKEHTRRAKEVQHEQA